MTTNLGIEWHRPGDPWCSCDNCTNHRISTRTWPKQDWTGAHDYNDILDAAEEAERTAEDHPNWGGPRTPGPGKTLGRKPKHRQHIRPYVPVETEDEARFIQALSPDERRARLLQEDAAAQDARRPALVALLTTKETDR